MLTTIEKVIFVLLALGSAAAAVMAADRIRRIVRRGVGEFRPREAVQRAADALVKTVTLLPTWRVRLGPSLFHAFIAWAFIYYLLVNLGDVLQGFIGGFVFLGSGVAGNVYRLIADVLSVA